MIKTISVLAYVLAIAFPSAHAQTSQDYCSSNFKPDPLDLELTRGIDPDASCESATANEICAAKTWLGCIRNNGAICPLVGLAPSPLPMRLARVLDPYWSQIVHQEPWRIGVTWRDVHSNIMPFGDWVFILSVGAVTIDRLGDAANKFEFLLGATEVEMALDDCADYSMALSVIMRPDGAAWRVIGWSQSMLFDARDGATAGDDGFAVGYDIWETHCGFQHQCGTFLKELPPLDYIRALRAQKGR